MRNILHNIYIRTLCLSLSKIQPKASPPWWWDWDSSIYPTTSRPLTSPGMCLGDDVRGCLKNEATTKLATPLENYDQALNSWSSQRAALLFLDTFIIIHILYDVIPRVYGWAIQPFTGPNYGISRNFWFWIVTDRGSFRTQVLPPMEREKKKEA